MEVITEEKVKIDITKEDFKDYQNIQFSGVTNMWNIDLVVQLSKNLTEKKCFAIMKNYSELEKEFK